jgi:type IV/VI secretion system ImpK/VasF family protein
MQERGHEQLADLHHNLHRTIQSQRGAAPPDLSLQWRGLEDQRSRLIRYVPWWVVVAAALAILGVTFAIYYSKLATQANPLHHGWHRSVSKTSRCRRRRRQPPVRR